jgi:hypothetical protein
MQVTKVSNMPAIADDLITWDYDRNMTVPFLAMVFDQCTDEICDQSGTCRQALHRTQCADSCHLLSMSIQNLPLLRAGYLDFDVYSETQPVRKGNPRVMEWRAVDCPVGETHKLEYLVCTPGTCNADDPRSVSGFVTLCVVLFSFSSPFSR